MKLAFRILAWFVLLVYLSLILREVRDVRKEMLHHEAQHEAARYGVALPKR